MSGIRRLNPRIGVGALCSPMEVGADRAPQAALEMAARWREDGCEVVEAGAVSTADRATTAGRALAEAHVEAIVLVAASWFEDYLVLDLLEECSVPVLLWSLPGMETGALCGTQQLTCYLRQLDKPYEAVHGALAHGPALDRARVFLRAAALHARLRRARIGLAGQRVRGMTEVAVNEIAFKAAVGPRVAPVDLVGLLQRASAVAPDDKTRVWAEVVRAAGSCRVSDAAGREAAGVYVAIRNHVRSEGLAALAFGCYPDFMGCACLAASLLADEGVPVGCEGDVNTTVAQLMLTWLTGLPTHNTDWLDPLDDGSVVFTHCGSGSYALAANRSDITLAPVRLANQGVCSLFPSRPGPVTLVSLMSAGDGYQMALMQGEALPSEMVFPGNPLRVRFSQPAENIIRWIHDEGIGHHWAAGYGHVDAELRAWAALAGQRLRLLEP